MVGTIASWNSSAVCRPGRWISNTNRVERSTRVPIAEPFSRPMIRSPSQCPGTARSAASAGRWLIEIVPTSFPRRSSGSWAPRLRVARPDADGLPGRASTPRGTGRTSTGRSSRHRPARRVVGNSTASTLAICRGDQSSSSPATTKSRNGPGWASFAGFARPASPSARAGPQRPVVPGPVEVRFSLRSPRLSPQLTGDRSHPRTGRPHQRDRLPIPRVNGCRRAPHNHAVGFTPPASRNHLLPASFDAPNATAACAGENPSRTRAQNPRRTSRDQHPMRHHNHPYRSGCCLDPWTPP